MRSIWSEKHRPQTLDELVGQPDSFIAEMRAILEGDAPMQHFLFCSPEPGTGKTTMARIIADTLGWQLHQFNASSKRQRGIEFVEDDVAPLARSGAWQTIFLLDEADRITPQAQDALKGVIEDATGFFILTANDLTRVSRWLQSRCQVRHFRPIPDDLALEQLAVIAAREGAEVDGNDLFRIVARHNGDLRNAIGALQTLAHLPVGEREAFTRALQVDEVNSERVLSLAMKECAFDDALAEMQGRPRDAIRSVFRYAVANPARPEAKMRVIEAAVIAERDLIQGVDEGIALHNFVRLLCQWR